MADVDISDLPAPPDATDISDLPVPSAGPQTVGGAAQAVTSGLLSGAGPDLVGMPMDTLQNSVGLLQAGAGALLRGSTTAQALPPGEKMSKEGRAGILPNGMYHWRAADGTEHMGRTPPPAGATAPLLTRPGPVPEFLEHNVTDTPWWGSSQWAKDMLPSGMVNTQENTKFNRYLHAGAEAIPAATMGNTGAVWKAVGAGTAAGLAQQDVVESGGGNAAAQFAGLLAGAATGHFAGGHEPVTGEPAAAPAEAPPAVEPEVHEILSQPLADGTKVPEAPPKTAPDPLNRVARGAEGVGGTGITVGRQTVGNGVNPTDAAHINQATHATNFPGASTPPGEVGGAPVAPLATNAAPGGPPAPTTMPSGVGAAQGGAIGFGKQSGVGRGRSTPLDDLTVVPLPPTDGNQAESSGGGETVPPVDRTMFGPRPQFGPSQVEPTPEGQANRTQTFQQLGMDEVPTSAITGDYRAAADDYVTAQLRGTSKENSASHRLGGVMDANRAAVEKAAADLAAGTGGLTGPETTTTKQDNDTRGRAMNAPITGLHDLVEQRMNEAYDAAEARQTGPVQLTELQDFLQNQRSAFKQVTANNGGMALHDAVSEKIRELGLDGNPTNPDFKPATTMQARALRQYVTGAWTPQNSRLVSEIKNRIDAGVVRAAGADFDEPARQLRTLNSVYLEEPEGVSQLLDQTKGNRLKINRTIDFDQVPQHVTSMAPDQFQHYLDVLKLGYQSGDPTLMAQSADAMRAVRAHLASGVTDMGRKTGAMWNAAGVNQYLRNNEPNMRAVFSPAEMSRYQDIDNAGRWLHTDKSYKGAAVQGHNLDNTIELGNGMLEAGGLHLGGPAGFVGGKLAGMGVKALNNAALRRVAESRITPTSGAAKPVVEESPSSAGKPPSGVGAKEGGAVGFKAAAQVPTLGELLQYRSEAGRQNTNSLAEAFNTAIDRHSALDGAERTASSKDAEARVGRYTMTAKSGVPDLLAKNMKMMKSEAGYGGDSVPIKLADGRGVETTGLSLAPAYQDDGINTCSNFASCAKSCLGKTSGGNWMFGGGRDLEAMKGPRLAHFKNTMAMLGDPEAFAIKLYDEVDAAQRLATRNGNKLGIRLNVLSDIHPKVHEALIKAFPDVDFYDYTKSAASPVAPNHHYTYSSTGLSQKAGVNGLAQDVFNPHQNWTRMRGRLDNGYNVAMPFSAKGRAGDDHLPQWLHDEETGKKYQVIDGDTHDYRPFDRQPEGAPGVIVGLRNKAQNTAQASAAKETDGFFTHYDPKLGAKNGRTVIASTQTKAPKALTNEMKPDPNQ